jgi:hypothetical protein
MNKKVLIVGGIGIIGALLIYLILTIKGTGNIAQNLQNSVKKEITVSNDVCAQFPSDWVASTIGKTIVKTKPFSMKGTYSCDYFINETNFIGINVDDLSVETQKKGQIEMGNSIKIDPRISMEHFMVLKPDGLIDSISLVLNPNRFVTIDRFYGKVFDNEGVIAFAAKVVQRIQGSESQAATATPTPQAQVPLPQEEDIVRNFFNLISERKIADAVLMMAPSAVPDDSSKQAWGVQFNAFQKISIKKIEKSDTNTYKVTLDVLMKPDAAYAQPMPYYGWGDGEFVRWVSLEKSAGLWKIVGIATGP